MYHERKLINILGLVTITAIVMISISACGLSSSTLSSSSIPSGGGSVSPSHGKYDKDVEVDIQAIPATGYRFDHWEGSVSGTSPNFRLTMDTNKNIVAYFKTLTPKSLNLIDGVITVQPGAYYHIPFTVDLETMAEIRVEGRFQASGGSGNDIKTFILDDVSYLNWVNGHPVTPMYYSGQITIADINIDITTSGDYHLVFENKFSIFSSKNVSARVDLHWSE